MRKRKIKPKVAALRESSVSGKRRFDLLALELRVGRELAERFGVRAGQRIGVAVSGGADSVALLRVLLALRERLGLVLSVVHFNHRLRGRASDGDEKFVAKLAARHGLAFFVESEDVAAKARRERANLEETARKSRYAFFERLVAQRQVDRIAVAHTADDQAETVLAHILRGTGIAGLGGIHPVAGNVFRPLLSVRGSELRDYLRSLKQNWREDATNRDVTRTRARIRAKLIPFLEKQFQPAVVEHLCQLAELAREDDASLNFSAGCRVTALAKKEKDGLRIGIQDLLGPKLGRSASGDEGPQDRGHALVRRMIRAMIADVKPKGGQLSAQHVEAVLRLAQDPDSGKSLHLPGGVEVRREHDSLCFRGLDTTGKKFGDGTADYCYPIDFVEGLAELRLEEHSRVVRIEVIDWPAQGRETSRSGAALDHDKLVEPLVLRNWRSGDSMQPLGHQKSHRLSRLLNELGVSRWEKANWPVLACGEKIAWCRSLPVAAEFAAGESTRKGVVIAEVPFA